MLIVEMLGYKATQNLLKPVLVQFNQQMDFAKIEILILANLSIFEDDDWIVNSHLNEVVV